MRLHQATDQRSILALRLSNIMGTPLLHRLTRLPPTKDTMGRVTTVARIRVTSVDSNRAWSYSSRRTRTRGVGRTSIHHQLVHRQERLVMVSSDRKNGLREIGGKSGSIDSRRGQKAFLEYYLLDMVSLNVYYRICGLPTWRSTLYMVTNRAPEHFNLNIPSILCADLVKLVSNSSNHFLRT